MAIPLRVPTVVMAALLLLGGLGAAQAATVLTFNSTDVPKPIPNPSTGGLGTFGGPADSTITVSGITSSISKLTVALYITHTWTSDLRLTLIAPGGAPQVVLAANLGGYNRTAGTMRGYGNGYTIPTAPPTTPPADGQVVFDDASPTQIAAIMDGSYTTNDAMGNIITLPEFYIPSGVYNCQGTAVLSIFNNLTPAQVNGVWTLDIVDNTLDRDNGNLVAWSVTITDPGVHTWTGAGTDANWSTAANWQGNNPPILAETAAQIVFPATALQLTNNNDIGVVRVGALTIAEGVTIAGTNINMADGGSISAGSGAVGTATIGMGVNLRGAMTVTTSTGFNLVLSGIVADNPGATGSLVINGPGTVRLAGNNSFSGAATVNSGIVEISNANSLGTIAGATTVTAGATLLLTAAVATNEPLILAGTGTAGQGALAATVSAVWAGPITLAPGTTGFGSSPGGITLTIGNLATVAAGSYGFSKVGPGNIVLNTALPVSTVLGANDGGTLTIGAAQPNLGGITLTGGTTIDSGGFLMSLSGGIACSASATASTISGTGTLDVGATARTIDVAAGSTLALSNPLIITGAGGVGLVGGGTVDWSANGTAVPVVMTAGILTGANGSTGAFTVTGGTINRSGPLATGALYLGAGSLMRFNGTGDQLNATGGVTLGSGLLQPFAAAGTVINNITLGPVNGTFRGMPEGNGVTYISGGNDVALSGLGANTVGFAVTSYAVAENGGSVVIQLIATGGSVTVALDAYGGSASAGADFILPSGLVTVLTTGTNVTIPIVNDNIAEGTEIANLVIIPIANGHLASPATSSATITITDDDDNNGKKCGFGTGLTVFFLFGFGLLLRLSLRRRR